MSLEPTRPTKAAPVVIPIRRQAPSQPEGKICVAFVWMATAASTAWRTWSSRMMGAPKTAINASPISLSTMASCWRRTSLQPSNMVLRASATSCGGRPSAYDVKPRASAKRTATSSSRSPMRQTLQRSGCLERGVTPQKARLSKPRGSDLQLFVLPPRSPKLNGHVERAQRTHSEELWERYEGGLDLPSARPALRAWERLYNTFRPHQALAQRTPAEYLTQCHPEMAPKPLSVSYVVDEYRGSPVRQRWGRLIPRQF